MAELSASDPAGDPAAAPWPPPARWLSGGILALAGLACLGSLVSALAPPTAGDALCYHLELPKAFLADHANPLSALQRQLHVSTAGRDVVPLGPGAWTAACPPNWSTGAWACCLGLATVVLATPIVGRPWAWVAGAVVVLVPGVNNQMTAPLNDVALALMTTLALAAWWRAVVGGRRPPLVRAGRAGGGRRAGDEVHRPACLPPPWRSPALASPGASPARRRALLDGAADGRRGGRSAWAACGTSARPGIAATRSIRSSAKCLPRAARPAETNQTLPASKSPLGRRPAGALVGPVAGDDAPGAVRRPGASTGRAVSGGRAGRCLFCRRLRGLGTLLAVALAYGVAWYLLRQNVRFLLPVGAAVGRGGRWVWIEMRRFPTAPAAGRRARRLRACSRFTRWCRWLARSTNWPWPSGSKAARITSRGTSPPGRRPQRRTSASARTPICSARTIGPSTSSAA